MGKEGTAARRGGADFIAPDEGDEAAETAAAVAAPLAPVFLARFGRGRLGGTTYLDWAADRAAAAGRGVLVADAAREPTLAALHPGRATRPRSVKGVDVAAWLTGEVLPRVVEGVSVCFDVGGGQDEAVVDYGLDLDVAGFCRDAGATPVAVYPLGPSEEDFDYALRVRDAGALGGAEALLVFNEGALARGQSPEGAFDRIQSRADFNDWLKAGAKPVYMRRLAAMDAVRRAGVGFSRAARWGRGAGDNAVGPVEAAQVKTWSVALEAWHAKVGATGCLP